MKSRADALLSDVQHVLVGQVARLDERAAPACYYRPAVANADHLIHAVAHEVQQHLNRLYAQVGTPEVGSALDQLGLRDGIRIVDDYLKHGEPGAAFEHVIYMLTEPDIQLSASAYEALTDAGARIEMAPQLWAGVRHRPEK